MRGWLINIYFKNIYFIKSEPNISWFCRACLVLGLYKQANTEFWNIDAMWTLMIDIGNTWHWLIEGKSGYYLRGGLICTRLIIRLKWISIQYRMLLLLFIPNNFDTIVISIRSLVDIETEIKFSYLMQMLLFLHFKACLFRIVFA